MLPVLVPLALLGNGIAAGVMLATAIGIVPMFLVLSYDRYVQAVQFLWPRYDPFMPVANGVTLLLDAALAVLARGRAAEIFFGLAVAALVLVMVISITKNVPINRYVKSLDPRREPTDWATRDPRLAWRNWNLLRTVLALAALAANLAAAATLL